MGSSLGFLDLDKVFMMREIVSLKMLPVGIGDQICTIAAGDFIPGDDSLQVYSIGEAVDGIKFEGAKPRYHRGPGLARTVSVVSLMSDWICWD